MEEPFIICRAVGHRHGGVLGFDMLGKASNTFALDIALLAVI